MPSVISIITVCCGLKNEMPTLGPVKAATECASTRKA